MSGTEATYQLIANIISKSYPTKILEKEINKVHSWDKLVFVASEQLLLPLIYWSLNKKALLHLLPTDLSNYLKDIYQINLNRNKAILYQLKDLAKLYKDHSINYVLIKGAAILVQLKDDNRGIRMAGDIDIMVASDQTNKAKLVMFKHGYQIGKAFNYERKDFRHLNRMVHENFIAAVEIHSKLFNKHNNLLPPRHLLKESRLIETYYVPSKEHIILNSILSTQINDHGQYYRRINFKSIYDCLLMGLPFRTHLKIHLRSIYEAHFLLATAQYFFHDFEGLLDAKLKKKWTRILLFQLNRPKCALTCYIVKRSARESIERINIFINNSNYRRHVFKNKIFPNFN